MRVRTAKQRAQRIDLYYFTHAQGMRRWRVVLSVVLPLAAILWIGAVAAAGSRRPFSAGPVSRAHAFAEARCEVCHRSVAADLTSPAGSTTEHTDSSFRRHTTAGACLACHDAPAHAVNETTPPPCASCHQEHRGRVALAKTDDRFCVECHGNLQTHVTAGVTHTDRVSASFPGGHPEFAAVKSSQDPAHLRFSHVVHLKDSLRGPNGPEKLGCATCHKPEIIRAAVRGQRATRSGLMAPVSYQQQCARCHPLFFDERIDRQAPHAGTGQVIAFVQQSLEQYIREHPEEISKSDGAVRRVPLNFPRPPEPAVRNAAEWLARRLPADERILWTRTCAECHDYAPTGDLFLTTGARLPVLLPTNITKQWMPRAAFDHTSHGMVTCASCHAAAGDSSRTMDVVLPNEAVCATCHRSSSGARLSAGGAESRCFECHRYHDWTKTHPVTSSYSLTDFK
jgi:hypothetical protein